MSFYGSSTYDAGLYGPDAPTGVAKVELLISGVWTDITAYLRTSMDSGVQITRGRGDEQSAASPSTCTMTLDNADGRFSPTNPSGAYYPNLSLGTQIKVSVFDSGGTQRVRFWGQVYEWPVSWDVGPTGTSDTNRTVQIVASGPRRRLQRNPNVGGPYYASSLGRSDIVGYWPCEDAATASTFASAVAGARAGTWTGSAVQPAGDTTWLAAPAGQPLMGDFSEFDFFVPAYASSGTWNLSHLLSVSDPTATTHTWTAQVFTTGAHLFEITYRATADTWTLKMKNQNDGSTEFTAGPTVLGLGAGVQSIVALELAQSGSDIAYELNQYTAANETGVGMSGTITNSTLGAATRYSVFNGTSLTVAMGEVLLQNSGINGLPTGALDAYTRETAYTRVARLSDENDVSVVRATGSASTLMGPQGPGTVLDLFDEAADTDLGLSSEAVDSLALSFRGSRDMMGDAAVLTLDLSMLMDQQSTYDDSLVVNDVTLSRDTGSSARATVTTGNRGTATIGYYSLAETFNVYSDDLLLAPAQYLASAGTMEEPRLPVLSFDALRFGGSLANVIAMREGDTVAVTGFTAGSGVGSSRRALVNGWTETITAARWLFDVVTQPHPLAYGFVLDDSVLGVLDTDRLGF